MQMKNAATLIAAPAISPLSDGDLAVAGDALTGKGAEMLGSIWLSDHEAADLYFTGLDNAAAQKILALAFEGRQIDFLCQPAEGRKKAMLIADMDSTIIEIECIDELADLVGLKDKVAAITEAAMRGDIDFEAALKERVALLAGLEEARLHDLYDQRLTMTAGAAELVATMNAAGALTCLVSGGFTWFTSRVAAGLGFAETRANRLVINGGKLTGKVGEPVLGAEAKLASLKEFRAVENLSREGVLAVGDGANDIAMLQEAGLGVAFHAKPQTRAAAGAAIDYADLTALLYMQGYTRAEFVTPGR